MTQNNSYNYQSINPSIGKEEFLRLSEPLHLTRGGEDSHGFQREHGAKARPTIVQVNVEELGYFENV